MEHTVLSWQGTESDFSLSQLSRQIPCKVNFRKMNFICCVTCHHWIAGNGGLEEGLSFSKDFFENIEKMSRKFSGPWGAGILVIYQSPVQLKDASQPFHHLPRFLHCCMGSPPRFEFPRLLQSSGTYLSFCPRKYTAANRVGMQFHAWPVGGSRLTTKLF